MKYYYFTYNFKASVGYGYGSCSCSCGVDDQFYISRWRKYINDKNNVECIITNWIEITPEQYEEYSGTECDTNRID